MNSRMNRYYEDKELENTRFGKNEELYKEISKSELDSYEVKSNTTILGDNKPEIDVEKIKQILDTKYKEVPKRRSIRIEEEEEVPLEKETTKEYDINVILEKAKEEKQENYEEERLKKLRDTQFDILKNLNLEKKEEPEESEEENLKSLINTIALNESKNKENTSLDILSELKGSGDTEVLEGLKEDMDDSLSETLEQNKISEEVKKEEKEEPKKDLTDTQMINSFYTSSNAIKDKDFEDIQDIEDFQKSIESNNVLLKVVIALIVIIFIVGIGLIIKNVFFS